ncbi:MAG TPA: VWA domain-containing protein, partial [Pyrinomonadaceae bacterium]|nr:VWA domain-containing protein [Pyrinomonadaceae bacterium]
IIEPGASGNASSPGRVRTIRFPPSIEQLQKCNFRGHTLRLFNRRLITLRFSDSKLVLLSLLFGVVCWCSGSTFAQQPDDVVRTDVSLVQLNIGVVDARGHAVTSLSRNDFTVYEDGVKQSIVNFEPTDAPFSLVLLLDASGSTVNFRSQLKQAALRFLDALGPEDRVAVIQFNAKVKNLSGFTTDRNKSGYAIQKLMDGAGETHFYDALAHALSELDKEGRRRKAIVVLTDGLDTSMRNADRASAARAQTDEQAIAAIDPKASPALNAVLTAADRQGVAIYPLALPSGDPKRLPIPDPVITAIYSAARSRLQNLADRTGGRITEIQRLDQMARLYPEVAANLRTLYTLGYQPRTERARDGKWHEIKVEINQPELIARTKPGYFAK